MDHHDDVLPIDPDLAPTDPAEPRVTPPRPRSRAHLHRSRPDVLVAISIGGMLGAASRRGMSLWLPTQAVPEEIDEAALLDGYGPVRKLFRITLPLISPTLLFLVVVLVIFGFQAFGQVEILTGGGPAGATETLVYKIFNSQQPLDQAEGAVMAIGLFGVTFVVSLLQIALLERRVHYGS